jgi:DNA-binding NarL/FixJ family response regulator
MTKLRIVLANRPQLGRDYMRKLIELRGDMEVVAESSDGFGLLVKVKETRADAVILSATESDVLGLCSHLLAEYPDLTILALGSNGSGTFIEQLCPSRWNIAHASNESALAALHAAICDPCGWIDQQARQCSHK